MFGRVKPKILQNMRGKTLAWKQIRLLQALLHGFQEWFTFSCGEGLDGCSTRLVEGVEPRMKYKHDHKVSSFCATCSHAGKCGQARIKYGK